MIKTHKRSDLESNTGKALIRKIRRDNKGLYVVVNGRKGRLTKTVIVRMLDDKTRYINITRKIDYFE